MPPKYKGAYINLQRTLSEAGPAQCGSDACYIDVGCMQAHDEKAYKLSHFMFIALLWSDLRRVLPQHHSCSRASEHAA